MNTKKNMSMPVVVLLTFQVIVIFYYPINIRHVDNPFQVS